MIFLSRLTMAILLFFKSVVKLHCADLTLVFVLDVPWLILHQELVLTEDYTVNTKGTVIQRK